MRRRDMGILLRRGAPFTVSSQVNGVIRVEPTWPRFIAKGCTVTNDPKEGLNWCERCQCNHIGGMFSRMGLAEVIEELLNKAAREIR